MEWKVLKFKDYRCLVYIKNKLRILEVKPDIFNMVGK